MYIGDRNSIKKIRVDPKYIYTSYQKKLNQT